jgi:predicted DNA-binding mobile mystery protein A
VSALEHAEAAGSITLKSLKRAAEGLHCDLVYALVPRESLENVFDGRIRTVAAARVKRASHNMALERQEVSDQETAAQVEELAARLRSESPRNLWNEVDSDGSAA